MFSENVTGAIWTYCFSTVGEIKPVGFSLFSSKHLLFAMFNFEFVIKNQSIRLQNGDNCTSKME